MIRNGVPCNIKAKNKKASWLLPQVELAVYKYVASQNIAADITRHGAKGTSERVKPREMSDLQVAARNSTKDATTGGTPEGNASGKLNPDGTLRTKGCVIGHRVLVPQMASRTQNIDIAPGPAQTYTTKAASQELKEFSQLFLPLTETVEDLFQTFLPSEHSKYRAAYEAIHHGRSDPVDVAFGIWTSRLLVINANTNSHKNLEDVCHGWCAVVAMGDFEGGDACFPELGV